MFWPVACLTCSASAKVRQGLVMSLCWFLLCGSLAATQRCCTCLQHICSIQDGNRAAAARDPDAPASAPAGSLLTAQGLFCLSASFLTQIHSVSSLQRAWAGLTYLLGIRLQVGCRHKQRETPAERSYYLMLCRLEEEAQASGSLMLPPPG